MVPRSLRLSTGHRSSHSLSRNICTCRSNTIKNLPMRTLTTARLPLALALLLALVTTLALLPGGRAGQTIDGDGTPAAAAAAATTLDCHVRKYTYKVVKADAAGRTCWDQVGVSACWGRCDSREISDWRFPNKKAFHPVCLHGARAPDAVTLRHCDPDAEPGTERYDFMQALSCRCAVCKSSEASCESVRFRGGARPRVRSARALR